MNRKAIILGLLMSCMISAYALAADDLMHHEHSDSSMGDMKENLSKTVEVGNKTCPVSGEEVGGMGPVVQHEYNGKIYNFCCAGCIATFEKDPEKYSKIAEENVKVHGMI